MAPIPLSLAAAPYPPFSELPPTPNSQLAIKVPTRQDDIAKRAPVEADANSLEPSLSKARYGKVGRRGSTSFTYRFLLWLP